MTKRFRVACATVTPRGNDSDRMSPGAIRYRKTARSQLPNGVETLVPGGGENSKVEAGKRVPSNIGVGFSKDLVLAVMNDHSQRA